jgi:chemotaxis protein methyltransferase CheR
MTTATPGAATFVLGDREFARFQKLIHEEAGICLGPSKKDLLVARLHRRLRVLGLASFKAYYAHVVDNADERARMLEHVATHETSFFREPKQLAFLAQRILPRLARLAADGRSERRVRAWSAGCATGEEAWTLAMLLHANLPEPGRWSIDILATDLSEQALRAAAEARYPVGRASEIPAPYLPAYMRRGVRSCEGEMAVGPVARSLVRFARHNLCTEPYPPGPFDLILCRNVLIYFDAATRERVFDHLVDRLGAEGLLLLGHAEGLGAEKHGLRYAGPFTYGRPTEGAWW